MDFNQSHNASSLAEFIKYINEFSDGDMLWYRGHSNHTYKLLPTLYREKVVDFQECSSSEQKNYNSMHYAEDIRIQQYYAKNYPFIKDSGRNSTEWLGMAQHFGINTRFFDWSTSSIHSLIFALDQYFDNKIPQTTDIPCVWVLKPQKLNKIIINNLLLDGDKDIEENIYRKITQNMDEMNAIRNMMKIFKQDSSKVVFAESNAKNKWGHLDYIYNLAYFDKLLELANTNPKLAFSGDILNPLFYLLAQIYINGFILGNDCLKCTPLAIIHPLNSERIKFQHGVFTVFPFPDKESYEHNHSSLEYMCMELNHHITGTLCKIKLVAPKKISNELKLLGIHKNWLFFEQDYISRQIENGL